MYCCTVWPVNEVVLIALLEMRLEKLHVPLHVNVILVGVISLVNI